jgi:hypothetical protein
MKARENPFAMWRLERVRYRFAESGGRRVDDWTELLRRFDGLDRRAALVGAHGSGKTTLLEEFGDHWEREGFRVFRFRLTAEQRALSAGQAASLSAGQGHGVGARDVVLLDGAEQLSWWSWRTFVHRTRAAGGLLITTHRSGRLPTLYECRTSPPLLAELATELAPEAHWPHPGACDELFYRHHGNLRDALRDLYDIWARRERSQWPNTPYGSSVTR